jgi:hypothetical protein
MTEYFQLTHSESQRLWAIQIASAEDWEVTLCPTADFHRRDGHHSDGHRLRADLAVRVNHIRRDELLIWGWSRNECLAPESLVSEFNAMGLTGYRLKPASVRFRDGRLSEEYRELVVVGWAGIASAESGIQVVRTCASCLYKEYSGLVDVGKLIDWSQWTGDDFFTVWPLTSYILITPRVAELLQTRHVKSYSLKKPDATGDSFGAGRLSSHMLDDVAKKYDHLAGVCYGVDPRLGDGLKFAACLVRPCPS